MFDAAPAEPGHASGTMNPHTATGRLSLAAGAAVWTFLILGAAANLAYFYSRGLSNLYGDGIAHVEGARRIFDSLTPFFTSWLRHSRKTTSSGGPDWRAVWSRVRRSF